MAVLSLFHRLQEQILIGQVCLWNHECRCLDPDLSLIDGETMGYSR
jgi:hypothetical protein